MDPVRIGRQLRDLRIRSRLRQSDVSALTGIPRNVIGEVERGTLAHISVDGIRLLAAALGAELDLRVRWHGEQLDRLADEAHSATVAATIARLQRNGWTMEVEVSFSIWGERGSIDILAWHEATSTLLVVEVKSVMPDVQATLHGLDRKARLAPEIAERFGWAPGHVARLLVVAESPTSRGRVRRHALVLGSALPDRGSRVRAWLRRPVGTVRGLVFLSNASPAGTTRGQWRRERVRVPRSCRMPAPGAQSKDSRLRAAADGRRTP
jgi:transcriptional regulator with XRE-family HTH domain